MYGNAGAGGTTQGGGSANVSGGSAPMGGQEIMGLQLMGAQKALIEAQTRKAEAEADKTAGVDTDLTKAQERMQRMQAQMFYDTYENTYSKMLSEAEKAGSEARMAAQTADVGEATMDERIKMVEGELIAIGIANELRKAEKELTQEQIKATIEAVKQKWEEVGVAKGKLKLDQFVKDVADSTKLTVETASKIVGEVIEAVGRGRK